jgi:hypothetical protein
VFLSLSLSFLYDSLTTFNFDIDLRVLGRVPAGFPTLLIRSQVTHIT